MPRSPRAAQLGSLLRATGWTVTAVAGSFVLGFARPWIVVAAITMTQRLTFRALYLATAVIQVALA